MGLKNIFSGSGSGRIQQSWMYDTKGTLVSSAAVADLNKGSGQNIVVGTKDGKIICIDQDGKDVWTFGTSQELGEVDSYFVDQERVHSIDAPPVVADVNLDGQPEIIAGTELGTLYCLSANGRLLWTHDCGGSIRAAAIVEDINLDGRPEILVTSTNNKLTALTGDGKKLFEYIDDAPIESIPGVLKSTKTRRILIVFGNNNGDLIAITNTQEEVWRVPLKDKITAAPAFLSTPEEERLVIGTHGGVMHCISEHGENVWEFQTEGSIYSKAEVADLNNDHDPEVVFGSCDNNVYALTSSGKRLWSYETDFWVTATPIVADIDHDGKLEVVAGSYDHNIYVLDSEGTYVLDYVPGLSGIVNQAGHYANILTADPGEQTGKKRWQYLLDSIIVGCNILNPAHGKPFLVVSTKKGKIDLLTHME